MLVHSRVVYSIYSYLSQWEINFIPLKIYCIGTKLLLKNLSFWSVSPSYLLTTAIFQMHNPSLRRSITSAAIRAKMYAANCRIFELDYISQNCRVMMFNSLLSPLKTQELRLIWTLSLRENEKWVNYWSKFRF